jgi:hypothetical protein
MRTQRVSRKCSILTHRRSCALDGCSGAVPTHLLALMSQWVFRGCSILTHRRSCALNGYSGAVPTHLLAFMRTWWAFRKCSTWVQPVNVPEGPMSMFSNLQSMQRPYKLAHNFHWMPFLWLRQARRHDVTNTWLIGGLGVRKWDWQQKIRKYCKNLEN